MAKGGSEPEYKHQVDRERLERGFTTTRYKEYGLVAPFVYIINASMPQDIWDGVFFSWLSMKGHLQGMHGLNRAELFATNAEGRIDTTFIIIWEKQEELTSWLEHGYSIEEMLRAMGVISDDIDISLKRDFS